MNDPVSLLQLCIALLVAVVPLAVAAGVLLREVSGLKEQSAKHVADDEESHKQVQAHEGRIIALERDAHAARSREQAMMHQIAVVGEKVDRVGEVVIRIDERLSRDDTSPRKRGV